MAAVMLADVCIALTFLVTFEVQVAVGDLPLLDIVFVRTTAAGTWGCCRRCDETVQPLSVVGSCVATRRTGDCARKGQIMPQPRTHVIRLCSRAVLKQVSVMQCFHSCGLRTPRLCEKCYYFVHVQADVLFDLLRDLRFLQQCCC